MADKRESLTLTFPNNKLLPQLFGDDDKYLQRVEERLKVSVSSRGNKVAIQGAAKAVEQTGQILGQLYAQLEKGRDIVNGDVDAAIRMVADITEAQPVIKGLEGKVDDIVVKTQKKHIVPYTPTQGKYIQMLQSKELSFAAGPAGTGKTYVAVAVAVSMLVHHKVDRLILSRPAVEAGEKLGYLPGDLKEKVDPYLRPLYDALYDMLPPERVAKALETGEIEIAPLAFMRGRTLRHSFIILDEAQNTTPAQMKMFLTRLGEGSRMAITGDMSQTDLPRGTQSGLRDAMEKLKPISEIGMITFEQKDIVRHSLTSKVLEAYDKHDATEKPDENQAESWFS